MTGITLPGKARVQRALAAMKEDAPLLLYSVIVFFIVAKVVLFFAHMSGNLLNWSHMRAAVSAVQSGAVSPDRDGVVYLPPAMQFGGAPERAYVTRWRRDGLAIVFPYTCAHDWLRGYLYHSRPLSEITLPDADSVTKERLVAVNVGYPRVATVPVNVVRTLDDHWAEVRWDGD